jgi:four helix bundle protein
LLIVDYKELRVNPEELKKRTRQFGLRVIRLVEALPKTRTAYTIGNQLLRSGTSVGANYWSSCRGRSRAEFAAKAGIAIEEADETIYWIGLLVEAGLISRELVQDLLKEADELISILTASVKTARRNSANEKQERNSQ